MEAPFHVKMFLYQCQTFCLRKGYFWWTIEWFYSYSEPGIPTTHIQEVFYFYFTQRLIRNTIHFYFVLLSQYSQCVQLVLGVLQLNRIASLYCLMGWFIYSVKLQLIMIMMNNHYVSKCNFVFYLPNVTSKITYFKISRDRHVMNRIKSSVSLNYY